MQALVDEALASGISPRSMQEILAEARKGTAADTTKHGV
jgi:hypothetical protein